MVYYMRYVGFYLNDFFEKKIKMKSYYTRRIDGVLIQ